jgi:hypothetical protein
MICPVELAREVSSLLTQKDCFLSLDLVVPLAYSLRRVENREISN